jgi:transcriptional regulator with XRE-family HTH domain
MNNLRELRIKAGISARSLGVAIGVAESTVTAWERGTRGLKPVDAKAALRALAKLGVVATLDQMYDVPRRKRAA